MPDFKKDLEAVIQRAKESGLNISSPLARRREIGRGPLRLANSHPSIYAILGVIPTMEEVDDQTVRTAEI